MWASALQAEKRLPAAGSAVKLRAAIGVFLTLLVVPPHDIATRLWDALHPWSDGAAVLLAAVVLLWFLRSPEAVPLAGLRLPFLACAGIALLSAAVNRVQWSTALEGLRGMLPWMVVGFAAAAALRPRDLPAMLRYLSLVACVLCGYGVLSFLAFRYYGGFRGIPSEPESVLQAVLLYPYFSETYFGGWHLTSTFLNDNYFGVWLAMLVPVTLAVTLNEPDSRRRSYGFASLGLMVIALTWTYSRGALVGAFGAALVFAAMSLRRLYENRDRRPFLWAVRAKLRQRWMLGLLLVPAVAAWLVMAGPTDRRRMTDVHATSGVRIISLQKTATQFRDNFLLGAGPGTRGLADVNYAKIGYETGALGLAAFGWLLFAVIRPAFRRGLSLEQSRLVSGLLAATAAVAIAAIGGEPWESPQVAVYYWLFAGSIGVLVAAKSDPSPDPGSTDRIECTTQS
jgi:hypothetical protein